MDIETFTNKYTPLMMRIVKRYAESEALSVSLVVNDGNHYQLNKLSENIKMLSEARMLLEVYPACDICFDPKCTSDHK